MIKSSVLLRITVPSDKGLQETARWYREQPGVEVLESIEDDQLQGMGQLPVLHITRKGTFLEIEETKMSFHPSMALLRVIQIHRGEGDRFLKVTELEKGDTFLDATFGLGTDSLMAATKVVGAEGKVIGIERSPLIAAVVREGLYKLGEASLPQVKNLDKLAAWEALSHAAKRIEVLWGDHLEILSQYPSKSMDVVYFDPMFRHTQEKSASIRPLHHFSDMQALNEEAIQEAMRIAKKRVVLKERKGSKEFDRLGFRIDEGGKYSRVDYGIIKL